MYCQSCGMALSQQMKYCNRCGAQLITAGEAAVIKPSEKRLDEYLDGLFWITVFGLGLILGGAVLMKKVQLSEWLIIAYLILSSAAFLINFVLSLWGALRIVRISKEANGVSQLGQLGTSELGPGRTHAILEAVPSVTENTTRSLGQSSKEPLLR